MSRTDSPLRSLTLQAFLAVALTISGLSAAAPADAWKTLDITSVPGVFPSDTIRSSDPRIRALFFEGAPYQGRPTRVFAWLGVPRLAPGETAPGIVLLHGGGGTAFESWVKLWVDRGYAAIAIDLFGGLPDPLDAKARPRNPDGGPAGGGAALGKLADPVEDQWPFHAVVAASRALSLLRAEPGVDPDRIGVTGISWGGYLTCLFAGVDPRLKFAVPVYGCGYFDETIFGGTLAKLPADKSALWWRQWDASAYLGGVRIPMLWANGTNDHFFWPPAWQKSYRGIPAGSRVLALRVGMEHGHPPAGDPPEVLAFADSIVRGKAPLARVSRSERVGDEIKVRFTSDRPVIRAELHYTTDGSGPWEKRVWQTLPASLVSGSASATLPADAAFYFFNLTDDRGLITSSEHEASGAAADESTVPPASR